MYEFLLWFFEKISDFITISLTWKIYGDLSLTHFIFGALFLIALFSLFGFSFPVLGNELELGVRSYKNNENKKERQLYYHETRSYRNTSGVRITNRYKINRETGEAKLLWKR